MTPISPARLAAARALLTVHAEPFAQSADVLSRQVEEKKLRTDDARLARAIVFGVLRHSLTLDFYYGIHLKQPAEKLDMTLRILLRMAAYQKHMLSKIPAYAITNDTVELGKTVFRLKPPQVGFLNAIVRKIVMTEVPPALPSGNRVSDLSVRYSFPQFLTRLFVAKYGTHSAISIMEACNEEPPLTIRVNTLRTNCNTLAQELEREGFNINPPFLAPEALIVEPHVDGKSLFDSAAFLNGHFYIQDEGSQMIAHLVAPTPAEKILDMCSAPGGKTTHTAELAEGGAMITATDYSSERLKRVTENVKRLQTPAVSIKPLEDVLSSGQLYDAVLVDAPCSGMGTIRRNPEIRYRITMEELERQALRQENVLEQAAPRVRIGGRLIYSTCSMSDIENKDVIANFLQKHRNFSVLKADNEIGVAVLRQNDGSYATWPQFSAVDGFEAVVLISN